MKIKKESLRAGEVRCLNCFERFVVTKGANVFACPTCEFSWRISWTTPNSPKIRGPVWGEIHANFSSGQSKHEADR